MVGFRAAIIGRIANIGIGVRMSNPFMEKSKRAQRALLTSGQGAQISKMQQRKAERGVLLLGVDLVDAREEIFVRLVTDGLSLGVAFVKAGFTSKDTNAAHELWHLPRVQERAAAVLEARRSTGVVTLAEVTDMLKRVYANAHASEEFSAAHNAAFSLARIYGHVTDKATLEVIRRPSRDPDAPSEQALASWVNDLPVIEAKAISDDYAVSGDYGRADREGADIGRAPHPPAALLGNPASLVARQNQGDNLGTVHSLTPAAAGNLAADGDSLATVPENASAPDGQKPSVINWLDGVDSTDHEHRMYDERDTHHTAQLELFNDFKGMTGGRPENGAPTAPVTGTPSAGAHSALLGGRATAPVKKQRGRPKKRKGPPKNGGKKSIKKKVKIPSAKALFG